MLVLNVPGPEVAGRLASHTSGHGVWCGWPRTRTDLALRMAQRSAASTAVRQAVKRAGAPLGCGPQRLPLLAWPWPAPQLSAWGQPAPSGCQAAPTRQWPLALPHAHSVSRQPLAHVAITYQIQPCKKAESRASWLCIPAGGKQARMRRYMNRRCCAAAEPHLPLPSWALHLHALHQQQSSCQSGHPACAAGSGLARQWPRCAWSGLQWWCDPAGHAWLLGCLQAPPARRMHSAVVASTPRGPWGTSDLGRGAHGHQQCALQHAEHERAPLRACRSAACSTTPTHCQGPAQGAHSRPPAWWLPLRCACGRCQPAGPTPLPSRRKGRSSWSSGASRPRGAAARSAALT